MLYAQLRFSELPEIGFAHHFYAENYYQNYKKTGKSLELVYVKSGGITAELGKKRFQIEPGSLFVLFRNLPVELYSTDGGAQSHCSVQLSMDYELSLHDEDEELEIAASGLMLPLVLSPGAEAEQLKKKLYRIVSQLGISREKNSLAASLSACGVLSELDRLGRRRLHAGQSASSLLEYQIKRYVAEHIHQRILLSELAAELGKTPNYLNSAFRGTTGTSIHRYISTEKMRLVGELMESKGLSFQMACENVAISDVSYGYRLFKKHMGVTPRAFLAGERRAK